MTPPGSTPSHRATRGSIAAALLTAALLLYGCAGSETSRTGSASAPEPSATAEDATPARPDSQMAAAADSAAARPQPDTARADTARADTARADTARRTEAAENRPPADPDPAPDRPATVDADSLQAFTEEGARLQDLFGEVFVRQDSTRLRSQFARRYLDRGEFLFTDNVVIFERGDTLTADTVRYDKNRKIGRARGNVRLTDGDVVVRAPRAVYYAQEKRSVFPDTVTLVDSTRVLRASTGTYFSSEDRAEFGGHVQMTDPNTYMEADSVTYLRTDQVSIARGNVFIERNPRRRRAAGADTTRRTFLFGERARNEETSNRSRVRGRALLVQIRSDSLGQPTDTLVVAAQEMDLTRRGRQRRVVATDSVRIWQADLAAVADSAVYDRFPAAPAADSASGLSASAQPDTSAPPDTTGRPSREETRLFKQPVVWFDNSQLTGHPIRVIARNRSLDSVYVDTDAFAVQEDSATQRLQQLKGRSMTASFRRDSLRRLVAQPTAETIWFRSTDAGELDGAIRASGDRIALLFRDGAITKAGVYGGVRSNYFQKEHVPEPFTLDGLRWMPERAPTKDEFLRQERLYRRFPTMRPPPAPAPTPAIPPDSLQTTRPSAPAARPPADSTAAARSSASTSSSLP
jgi:lipopolysaccharide export system protein LptA